MADFSEERMRSSLMDVNGENPTAISLDGSQSKKTCADCGTSKTPLWRGGPAGPKSLCNACGIKSRKKKRPVMGMRKNGDIEVKKMKRSKNGGRNSRFLGREGLVKILMVDRQRIKMGGEEEEEAAVLLMALSHGYYSVYGLEKL